MTEPVIVTRNGVNFTFTKATTGKKHSVPGLDFWFPKVTFEQLHSDPDASNNRVWFGDVLEGVNKLTRVIFTDLAIEHTVDGVLNVEGWRADAADFAAGRAKIADLEEEVAILVDSNVAIVDKMMALIENDGNPDEIRELQEKSVNIMRNQVKPLRTKIADIQAKYAKIAAAREAKGVTA